MDFFQFLPGLLKELGQAANALLNFLDPISHEMPNAMRMAGQAGLEPATTGFGVRRSSQLELLTPVSQLDFYLAMQGMDPARRAEFLKGQFLRGLLSIFGRRVILSLTLVASKPYEFPHNRSLPSLQLLDDLGHDAGADSLSTFADREFQTLIHGNRGNQLDLYVDVVAGHNHFGALGKLYDSGDIGGPEVELWPIAVKKRRVPSTFFFG